MSTQERQWIHRSTISENETMKKGDGGENVESKDDHGITNTKEMIDDSSQKKYKGKNPKKNREKTRSKTKKNIKQPNEFEEETKEEMEQFEEKPSNLANKTSTPILNTIMTPPGVKNDDTDANVSPQKQVLRSHLAKERRERKAKAKTEQENGTKTEKKKRFAPSSRLLSLYNDAKRVADKVALRREKQATTGCTFAPNITKKANKHQSSKGSDRFHWLYNNAKSKSSNLESKRKAEESKYSFTPNLISKRTYRTTTRQSNSKSRHLSLYENAKRMKQKLDAKREQLPKSCTFKPKINRSRKSTVVHHESEGGISTRLYPGTEKMKQKVQARKQKQEEIELKGCTFEPDLNHRTLQITQRPEYASKSMYERFNEFQQKKTEKVKALLAEKMVSTLKECTFQPEIKLERNSLGPNELFRRLYNQAFERERRLDQLRENWILSQTNGFRPNGNFRTFNFERIEELHEIGTETVYQRMCQEKDETFRHSLVEKAEEEALVECTFHPSVNRINYDDGVHGQDRREKLYNLSFERRNKMEHVRIMEELEASIVRSRAYTAHSVKMFDRIDKQNRKSPTKLTLESLAESVTSLEDKLSPTERFRVREALNESIPAKLRSPPITSTNSPTTSMFSPNEAGELFHPIQEANMNNNSSSCFPSTGQFENTKAADIDHANQKTNTDNKSSNPSVPQFDNPVVVNGIDSIQETPGELSTSLSPTRVEHGQVEPPEPPPKPKKQKSNPIRALISSFSKQTDKVPISPRQIINNEKEQQDVSESKELVYQHQGTNDQSKCPTLLNVGDNDQHHDKDEKNPTLQSSKLRLQSLDAPSSIKVPKNQKNTSLEEYNTSMVENEGTKTMSTLKEINGIAVELKQDLRSEQLAGGVHDSEVTVSFEPIISVDEESSKKESVIDVVESLRQTPTVDSSSSALEDNDEIIPVLEAATSGVEKPPKKKKPDTTVKETLAEASVIDLLTPTVGENPETNFTLEESTDTEKSTKKKKSRAVAKKSSKKKSGTTVKETPSETPTIDLFTPTLEGDTETTSSLEAAVDIVEKPSKKKSGTTVKETPIETPTIDLSTSTLEENSETTSSLEAAVDIVDKSSKKKKSRDVAKKSSKKKSGTTVKETPAETPMIDLSTLALEGDTETTSSLEAAADIVAKSSKNESIAAVQETPTIDLSTSTLEDNTETTSSLETAVDIVDKSSKKKSGTTVKETPAETPMIDLTVTLEQNAKTIITTDAVEIPSKKESITVSNTATVSAVNSRRDESTPDVEQHSVVHDLPKTTDTSHQPDITSPIQPQVIGFDNSTPNEEEIPHLNHTVQPDDLIDESNAMGIGLLFDE